MVTEVIPHTIVDHDTRTRANTTNQSVTIIQGNKQKVNKTNDLNRVHSSQKQVATLRMRKEHVTINIDPITSYWRATMCNRAHDNIYSGSV